MNKNDVLVLIASTVVAFIAVALPVFSLIWKVFGVVAELRLQIQENRNQIEKNVMKIDFVDTSSQGMVRQVLQRWDHTTKRLNGEIESLKVATDEIQGYLEKTTDFKVRR